MTDEEIQRYLKDRDGKYGPGVVSSETLFQTALYERVVALETASAVPKFSTPTLSVFAKGPRQSLIFIVNGEEVNFPVTPGMLMRHARAAVLEQTGNTGRTPDEWEMRDVYGNPISPDAVATSFAHEQRIFCTIVIGTGG